MFCYKTRSTTKHTSDVENNLHVLIVPSLQTRHHHLCPYRCPPPRTIQPEHIPQTSQQPIQRPYRITAPTPRLRTDPVRGSALPAAAPSPCAAAPGGLPGTVRGETGESALAQPGRKAPPAGQGRCHASGLHDVGNHPSGGGGAGQEEPPLTRPCTGAGTHRRGAAPTWTPPWNTGSSVAWKRDRNH